MGAPLYVCARLYRKACLTLRGRLHGSGMSQPDHSSVNPGELHGGTKVVAIVTDIAALAAAIAAFWLAMMLGWGLIGTPVN